MRSVFTHSREGAGSGPSSDATEGRLDGAALAPTTLLLIACGVIGSLLFVGVYLIEGATRSGYVALEQPISALSLGPDGWVQQANFIVFGLLSLCAALGWRQALTPGDAALSYPILRAIEALGLIADRFFSQDPSRGYPVGVSNVTTPSLHAIIHTSFAFVTITAIACSCFALAWRFVHEPRWRVWAIFAVLSGILTIVFIAIFGSLQAQPGSLAGLFERASACRQHAAQSADSGAAAARSTCPT